MIHTTNVEKLPIYTYDLETDPFKVGRLPKPFAAGLYTGTDYYEFWGANCIAQVRAKLDTLPKGLIYAHNGGKFDFFFSMEWFTGNPFKIISGRIVEAIDKVGHVFRDSYAILPIRLATFDKYDIDIQKLEENVREKHKHEICRYLKQDCVELHKVVTDFCNRFGRNLTIASTAMKELKKMHAFSNADKKTDEEIRTKYYFGGRVECFEKGQIKGKFKVYDVNGMYQHAMKNFKHPISATPGWQDRTINKWTAFVTCTGYSYGAFPVRTKQGLSFPHAMGQYHVTIHEFNAAMEHGLFELESIDNCIHYAEWSSFDTFVDTFTGLKIKAEKEGDKQGRTFYKLIACSAYGKFAQNPSLYKDYCITDCSEKMEGWNPETVFDELGYMIWTRKAEYNDNYYNVATASSITGAARSVLLRAISNSKNPIYCDTDSLICEQLNAEMDATKIGAWKHEADCDTAYIAGKKLYALRKGKEWVKKACKGVNITEEEIASLTRGKVVRHEKQAPSFKLSGRHVFVSRNVRMV